MSSPLRGDKKRQIATFFDFLMKADILAKMGMSGQKPGHFITVYIIRRCSFMSIKKVDKTDKKMDIFVL